MSEVVTVLAAIVSAGATGFLTYLTHNWLAAARDQLALARQQLEQSEKQFQEEQRANAASVARSREERAMELLTRWDTMTTPNFWTYIKWVRQLPDEELSHLYASRPFQTDVEVVAELFPELPDVERQRHQSGGRIPVPAELRTNARYASIKLLNAVETIAICYVSEVVDRDMIDKAFRNSFLHGKTGSPLKFCCRAQGDFGDSFWPAVQDLGSLMQERERESRALETHQPDPRPSND